MNPEDSVVFGAAVQGGIVSGKSSSETQDLLSLDVTPLSQGIETVGGVMTTIIKRNTVFPQRSLRLFPPIKMIETLSPLGYPRVSVQ